MEYQSTSFPKESVHNVTQPVDFLSYFRTGPPELSPNRSDVIFGLKLYLFQYNSEANHGASGKMIYEIVALKKELFEQKF